MGSTHDPNDSPHARRRTGLLRACLFGLSALGLIVLGVVVGATWALRRTEGIRTPAAQVTSAPAPAPAPTEPVAEAEIVLTSEALTRAGIKTAPVSVIGGGPAVTVPGSVIANAYREVKVTPIAPGIVTKVHADLGTVVKRGAPLLSLFRAELAHTKTKYLFKSAMQEADQKKIERNKTLEEIGAASRQELEEITTAHEA